MEDTKPIATDNNGFVQQTEQSLQENKSKQVSFYRKYEKVINTISAVIGIAGAIYGGIVYIDSRIESKILSKIEPYQEFTTALALQQNGFNFNAAQKLNKLYYKLKKEDNTEILPSVVAALLESIAESGNQEEFLHTVDQIQKDNIVPLKRRNLNDIGLIYLDIGQLDKAEQILKTASTLIQASSTGAKTDEAITHWRLSFIKLVRGDTKSAADCFLRACKISPSSFKKSEFNYPTPEAATAVFDDDTHFQRMRKINPDLDKVLSEMSREIQKQ